MATDKIQTGVRFEEDLLLKITYLAKKEFRSFNAQMEYLAERCVREYEAANGPIEITDDMRGAK